MVAAFFGSIINLGLAITTIVFMGILLNENVSTRLSSLQMTTDRLEDNITQVESGVTDALDCQDALYIKNETFINCTDTGNAECTQLTCDFINTQNNLTALTVESLQKTLDNVLLSCNNQTDLLRMLIAEVAPNTNPPTLLDSGTTMVSVEGAVASFSAGYELYRLVLGGELQFDYLVLLPWGGGSVTTATVNPTVTYTGFSFLGKSVGTRFLLNTQQGKFSGTITVATYGMNSAGDLVFYTEGTGTIQLTKRLSIQ